MALTRASTANGLGQLAVSADPEILGRSTALLLVPVPDLGGVARHVLDITAAGVPGWHLVVLCPEGKLAELLRARGVAVVAAPFGPGAGLAASIRSLRETVRTLHPQIVHSHLAYADFVSGLTWLPDGVRRISTEHGIAGEDSIYHGSSLKSRLMATAHAVRQRRFAARIAVSNATARAMREKWRISRKIIVIPNGVDAPATIVRNVTDPEAPRILSLSRLAPEKRLDQLLEAFALLHKELPQATLTVAGEGPLQGELQALIEKLGLEDSVRLPGFIDSTAAMNEADVVVQLSVWENCSYTLLDAVARGLPVVASRVGGNAEIVPEKSLVDTDDIASVATRIRTIVRVAPVTTAPIPITEMARRLSVVYDRTVGETQ